MPLSSCILEVDLAKIKHNYRILQNICTDSLVGAVVKADGYGLGANYIAKSLEQENCNFFFVSSSDEGVKLRKTLNSKSKIFILHGVCENNASDLIEHQLIPVLNNLKQISIWQKFSKIKQKSLPCFLHIDTGINRLGLTDEDIKHIIDNNDILTGLQIQYIISHLSASDEPDNPYNLEQLRKLKNYLQYFPNIKVSLANSSGILLGKEYHFDLVRSGAALYGLNPLGSKHANPMLNPVTLKAPIIHLQKLTPGSSIGYNKTFTTIKHSIIATLPLGYADGYNRSYSNNGEVYINNKKAKIVGRISMDLINIDVTNLPPSEIFLGQEVEIIGKNCTPDNIASIIGTIGYEILTNLGRGRYRRIYKNA